MAEDSKIAWTDHTFNPWWGCSRVSAGCQHCYAEALAKRWGRAEWGDHAERVPASETTWRLPVKWNREAEAAGHRRRVFCASMSDVFEDRPELAEHRDRLWSVIDETPSLDWLLLTKRPQNVMRMVPEQWHSWTEEADIGYTPPVPVPPEWPRNVWVGTTVENQAAADDRIPHLLAVPAPVRFLSCEPLLGPVNLFPPDDPLSWLPGIRSERRGIDWVIVGGESGPGHRPMDLDWARDLVAQVSTGGLPVFFKQVSGPRPGAPGPVDLEAHKTHPEVQP